MEGIILAWIALSFVCAIVLEQKSTGFWGTFGLCLLLSPLLGVIIAVSSGNRPKSLTKIEKTQKLKKELLNQIEELKKEEALGLISEANKLRLNEMVASYKKYNEQVIQESIPGKNSSQKEPSWISTIILTLGLILALFIFFLISRVFQ